MQAAHVAPIAGVVTMPPGAIAGAVATFAFSVDGWGRVTAAAGRVAGTQGSSPSGHVSPFVDAVVAADLDINGRAGNQLWTDGHIVAASLGGPPLVAAGLANRGWANVNAINFFPQQAIHNNQGSPYSDQEVIAATLFRHLGADCVNVRIDFVYPPALAPHPGSGVAAAPLVGGPQPFYTPHSGTYTVSVADTVACLPPVAAIAGGGTLAQRWSARLAAPPAHVDPNPAHAAQDLTATTAWGVAHLAGGLTSARPFANYPVLNALRLVELANPANILVLKHIGDYTSRRAGAAPVLVPTAVASVAVVADTTEGLTCSTSAGVVRLVAIGAPAMSAAFVFPPIPAGGLSAMTITCQAPLAGSWVFDLTQVVLPAPVVVPVVAPVVGGAGGVPRYARPTASSAAKQRSAAATATRPVRVAFGSNARRPKYGV